MLEREVCDRVAAAFPHAIVDVAGEGCSFEVMVIAAAFAGQSPLARQRAVLALFGEEIRTGAIHALSVIAKTPEEDAAPRGLVQIDGL